MSLLLADDGTTLNTLSVDIPVTLSVAVQKKVNKFQDIAVTLTPDFSRLVKFLQSAAVVMTLGVTVQKLIKQSQAVGVTLAVEVQKKILTAAINVDVAFTVIATEAVSFFRSFSITTVFSLFVDALKIFGSSSSGGDDVVHRRRHRWRGRSE